MEDLKDRLAKFSAAYERLGRSSTLLVRASDRDGTAEVWEDQIDQVLTVVDFGKIAFFTKKRQDNPAQYEAARKDFLAMEGGIAA